MYVGAAHQVDVSSDQRSFKQSNSSSGVQQSTSHRQQPLSTEVGTKASQAASAKTRPAAIPPPENNLMDLLRYAV